MPERQELRNYAIAISLIVSGAAAIYFSGETRNINLFLPGFFSFCAGIAILT